MLLSLGYIHEATTFAESCGGGGSPGSGWGRDKDGNDEHWWRRCIAVSAAMMRLAKYRQHSEMLCNVAHDLCTPSRFIFNI